MKATNARIKRDESSHLDQCRLVNRFLVPTSFQYCQLLSSTDLSVSKRPESVDKLKNLAKTTLNGPSLFALKIFENTNR